MIDDGDLLLEERLGFILGVGVRASTVCLIAGLLLALVLGESMLSTLLLHGGLLVLMATPVARVAAAVVDYGFGRDWIFFTLTALVLLELSASIIAALLFHGRL